MKLYVEGVTAGTGWKVIGWLEIINGMAFVCQKDETLGVKKYAVSEVTRYIRMDGMEAVYFGAEIEQ